jgi:hypothetical protein
LQIPQIEVANFAKCDQIHLGVGPGGRGAAVTQVVANLLERQALRDEAGGAGMAERVRTNLNAKCCKSSADDLVDAVGR